MADDDPQHGPSDDQPRRRRGLLLVLLIGAAAAIGLVLYLSRSTPATDQVTASAGRLTLERDTGQDLKIIDRRVKPELWYRVTLDRAPVGAVLALTCEWIDPAGRLFKRHRYETQPIDRPVWPTHARCRLGPDAPVGTWHVRLLLRGRPLHELTFQVEDGETR